MTIIRIVRYHQREMSKLERRPELQNINLKSKQRNDPKGSRPGYHKRLFRNKMCLINHVKRNLNSSFYFNLSWKWSDGVSVCVHYIQVLNNNHLLSRPNTLPPMFSIILTRPLISGLVHFGHVTIIWKRTHTALLHTIENNRGVWSSKVIWILTF